MPVGPDVKKYEPNSGREALQKTVNEWFARMQKVTLNSESVTLVDPNKEIWLTRQQYMEVIFHNETDNVTQQCTAIIVTVKSNKTHQKSDPMNIAIFPDGTAMRIIDDNMEVNTLATKKSETRYKLHALAFEKDTEVIPLPLPSEKSDQGKVFNLKGSWTVSLHIVDFSTLNNAETYEVRDVLASELITTIPFEDSQVI